MTWTQPLCEACWVAEHGVVEGGAVIGLDRLPHRFVGDEPELQRCCQCGNLTFVGIFIRRDPKVVPFPRMDPEDAA